MLGDTGALVAPGDPSAMAEAALQLLRNPDLHRQHSAASRARAVEHFQQSDIVDRYLDVYYRVMAES